MSSHAFHRRTNRLLPWTVLAFFVLMAVGALGRREWPYAVAVPVLVLMLALMLPVRRVSGFACWLALGVGLLWLDARGHAREVLGTLPILINAGLCWIFARTLRHGREALVTRVVRMVEGEERLAVPGLPAYSRAVTVYWALLTGVQSLVLALCWIAVLRQGASAATWVHVWLHVGGYALPAAAMLAEYAVRRWRFRAEAHLAPHEFVRRLVACWPRLVRESGVGAHR